MAYKNTVIVYIDGINWTSNVVVPVKYGNFLDERLDECNLSMRAVRKETFSPLTPVEMVIRNDRYWGGDGVVEHRDTETKYYVIANDDSTEMQIGKSVYNHELYLIEVTKVAECYVVDTLTFTNDLGRAYTNNAQKVIPFINEY